MTVKGGRSSLSTIPVPLQHVSYWLHETYLFYSYLEPINSMAPDQFADLIKFGKSVYVLPNLRLNIYFIGPIGGIHVHWFGKWFGI